MTATQTAGVPVRALEILAAMALEALPPDSSLEAYIMEMAHTLRDPIRHEELRHRCAGQRPKIVCLCGSARYFRDFVEMAALESLKGHIVLTIHGFHAVPQKSSDGKHLLLEPMTAEQKKKLDALHLRKIELADEVLILNRDRYIGPSTLEELQYARKLRKPVRFLEIPEPGLV